MFRIIFIAFLIDSTISSSQYYFDTTVGLGRSFDGIGAISGGGATSKLLVNYPKKQLNEILDLLFMPSYGASLQIFKVEIGGDAQSSAGSEASHMHEEWDENYQRGYEWFLMKEAKKRNPKIRLCGLPWGFPSWLGQGSWNPYVNITKTADYIMKWVWGAKNVHQLDIDCIGIWNEKPYNAEYIKVLRKTLDMNGFNKTLIIAADNLPGGAWDIVDDIYKDPQLNSSVDIIGVHYMGGHTSVGAQKLTQPLWSSEDIAYGVGEEAAGCIARTNNQNYVFGKFTSTINWDLISSFYEGLYFTENGLMKANEPWSGHYIISSPIWATAHTTQFTEVGWKYLLDNHGVGILRDGGTYVTLISPDLRDFTIIVETMDTSRGNYCLRTPSRQTPVKQQIANFVFQGVLVNVTQLNLWESHIYDNGSSQWFIFSGKQHIVKSILSLNLNVNSVYTLTTINAGTKVIVNDIPKSIPFPLPYKENFEDSEEFSEPVNFSPQIGVFEVIEIPATKNKVMRQSILAPPIHWCPFLQSLPFGVIGTNWLDIKISIDILFPAKNYTNSIFVAARVSRGGCVSFLAKGVFLHLSFKKQMAVLSYDLEMSDVIETKSIWLELDYWYNVKLILKGNMFYSYLDNKELFNGKLNSTVPSGYVALGSGNFALADFDNLYLS